MKLNYSYIISKNFKFRDFEISFLFVLFCILFYFENKRINPTFTIYVRIPFDTKEIKTNDNK